MAVTNDAEVTAPSGQMQSRAGGRMTGSELIVARSRLGMSRSEFARVLSVKEDTVRRWEIGKDPIPVRLGDEIREIEIATDRAVNSLLDDLRSMPSPRVVVFREHGQPGADRLDPAGYGPGWWRAVAGRAAQEVPGTRIGTADEFAEIDAEE